MAHFVHYTNNGLTAVVTADDYENIQSGEALEHGIFLFTDDNFTPDLVSPQPWVHGNAAMLAGLLKGHTTAHRFLGVPFSNGATLYGDRGSLLEELLSIAPTHRLLTAFEVEFTPVGVMVS